MKTRTIEIDWDIHQAIEAERRDFDDPPRSALRRLLGLPEKEEGGADKEATFVSDGLPWAEDGVRVPHGSEARMEYDRGRQLYEGRFLDGMLVVNGKKYPSLSSAADDLAVTKRGKKTSLNGWLYWKVKFPGQSHWQSLDDLRKAARSQRS